MNQRRQRRLPRKETKPQDELEESLRRFGHGLPLEISRVRALARSRRLPPKQRAHAWKLVAYLHEDADEFELAWSAYEKAVRTSKAMFDEVLTNKAALLRNEAVESAWKMLCSVDVSALTAPDRFAYWVELLDTAKLSYDPSRLRSATRRVWKRDLRAFGVVADDCEFCRKLIRFLESHYGRSHA